mmetsp:Transcript_147/g.330  ORF Transcript_147/g.330 Transcript_147/m.330 type:complete len:243 (-) Transcript_147:131-859(-)
MERTKRVGGFDPTVGKANIIQGFALEILQHGVHEHNLGLGLIMAQQAKFAWRISTINIDQIGVGPARRREGGMKGLGHRSDLRHAQGVGNIGGVLNFRVEKVRDRFGRQIFAVGSKPTQLSYCGNPTIRPPSHREVGPSEFLTLFFPVLFPCDHFVVDGIVTCVGFGFAFCCALLGYPVTFLGPSCSFSFYIRFHIEDLVILQFRQPFLECPLHRSLFSIVKLRLPATEIVPSIGHAQTKVF